MKRTRLQRNVGLARGSRLKATSGLRRGASTLGKRPRDTGPGKKIKDLVKDDRAGGVCERCGKRSGHHVHHRDPRGMGGTSRPEVNNPSNLLFLCVFCHLWVENNRLAAIGEGYLIPDMYEMDSLNTPVLLWHGRKYLDDNGGFDPPQDNAEEAS